MPPRELEDEQCRVLAEQFAPLNLG